MSRVLLLLLASASCILGQMDWCEYWARMGKQDSRPECRGFELGKTNHKSIHQAPARSRNAADKMCPTNEVLGCRECDLTCSNLTMKCEQKGCTKQCVCRTGFARNATNSCVNSKMCAESNEDSMVVRNVKRMFPLLLKDMWKAMFGMFRGAATERNNRTEIIG